MRFAGNTSQFICTMSIPARIPCACAQSLLATECRVYDAFSFQYYRIAAGRLARSFRAVPGLLNWLHHLKVRVAGTEPAAIMKYADGASNDPKCHLQRKLEHQIASRRRQRVRRVRHSSEL